MLAFEKSIGRKTLMYDFACNLEQVIELDYYDLFALEDALKLVPPRHGLALRASEFSITHSLYNDRQNIPIGLSGYLLASDNNLTIEISLSMVIDAEYKLTLTTPSSCHAAAFSFLPTLAYDLEKYIKQFLPTHFVSMEHLINYLGVNCKLVLTKLNVGLAWPIWQATEELFADFADGEEICFRDHPAYPPGLLKVETHNGPAQLMKINCFRLKRKAEIIMAAGLKYNCERVCPVYELVLFVAHEHMDRLYERFERYFDPCFRLYRPTIITADWVRRANF